MPHKIIKASEAAAIIKSFLDNENHRTTKIAVLSLEEVNVYIKAVQAMQKECENIFNYFKKITAVMLTKAKGDERYPVMTYKGYEFSVNTDYDWNTKRFLTGLKITPPLPFEALGGLLLELEQQKDHLVELKLAKNKLQEKVNRDNCNTNSLTTVESKADIDSIIESTMSDAQDQFALQAIDSYHALVNQTREVFDKFKTLKNQETLLESTLAQNEKLQTDLRLLQSQLDAVTEESKLGTAAAALAKREVLEQKVELDLLKHHEPSITEIKRQSLVDLLDSFGYKSGFSLFSSEETIEKLKSIAKSNKEMLSIEQIKNCITDSDDLRVFNYPYSSPILSKTELLIRDIAFLFRSPQAPLPRVSNSN